MDILTDIPLLIGLVVATAFLMLGLVLIYMMFFADRPKKEKATAETNSSRFAQTGGVKKGGLVARGRKLSKDEVAQSVFNRPDGGTRPEVPAAKEGFSFGGSQAEPLGNFEFPQATAEPRPTQGLPSAPSPVSQTGSPVLPPRIRRPGQQ